MNVMQWLPIVMIVVSLVVLISDLALRSYFRWRSGRGSTSDWFWD